MNPSKLQNFLVSAIKNNLPVLITGAPGVGKSAIVAQACALAGARMILSHPVVSDPTDFKGLPWAKDGAESATFLPFGEMHEALNATEPTVWFLDDLGQASPSVQAAAMQLILARRVNGHKIPDCVTFIAATNRRGDKAGVQGILEPVKSRFASIIELGVSLDDWCNWAISEDLPIELISFIRFRGGKGSGRDPHDQGLLHNFVPSADMTNSPCPRTWANVARLMALDLPTELQFEAFKGAVGEGAATEFLAFLEIRKNMPSLDAILLDPQNAEMPKEIGVKWAVAVGLAARATSSNFDRIAIYCERMRASGMGEFAVLCIRDAMRRTPEVKQTASFIKMMSGNLGRLFSGQLS